MVKDEKRYTYKSGELVKNINSQEVGVILETEDNHSEYYKILCDGEVVSWFTYNLSPLEKHQKNKRKICHTRRF
tara:strand:+ start:1590 stop:1811 length:222 start_codon:yes stop_codon:yes gene_type:complete